MSWLNTENKETQTRPRDSPFAGLYRPHQQNTAWKITTEHGFNQLTHHLSNQWRSVNLPHYWISGIWLQRVWISLRNKKKSAKVNITNIIETYKAGSYKHSHMFQKSHFFNQNWTHRNITISDYNPIRSLVYTLSLAWERYI